MSEGGESPRAAPVEEVPEVAAPAEVLDLNTAISLVLKKALAHDGLARGLSECTRALERGTAQLALLAEDCNQPDYKKLIEALAAERQVSLITVPEAAELGKWAGLFKINPEGEAVKVVKCSAVVITNYGEESPALAVLQEHLASRA